MITPTVQTCIGQEPNTKWEGTLISDHMMGKTVS